MFFNARNVRNITSEELREKLARQEDLLLLDVRTPMEHLAHAIEGSLLLPVQELSFRSHEVPRDREIIVYCRVGNRSAFASAFLAQKGYNVRNLEGGILSWAMAQEREMAQA